MNWNDLTTQQRIALRWPCYFAVETSHPRYVRQQAFGSLLLTVNTGYE